MSDLDPTVIMALSRNRNGLWRQVYRLAAALAEANRKVAVAGAVALNAAADDVQRVREQGLRPDEDSAPSSAYIESWLRNRATLGGDDA